MAVTLWMLSSLPGQDIHLPPFPEADKVAHFGYFFIGGFLLAWVLRRKLLLVEKETVYTVGAALEGNGPVCKEV
jgi:hypothetical protein